MELEHAAEERTVGLTRDMDLQLGLRGQLFSGVNGAMEVGGVLRINLSRPQLRVVLAGFRQRVVTETVELRDGRQAVLRPITTDDSRCVPIRRCRPVSGRTFREGPLAPRLRGPIVGGTDGSETAAPAVASAAELAHTIGLELYLVTAFRPSADARLRHQRLEAPADIAHRLTLRHEADAILPSAADDLDVDPRMHASAGDPAEVLIEVAEEVGAALIVVGYKA